MAVAETSKEAYRSLTSLSRDQSVARMQIEYMENQANNENELPSRRDIAYELGWETSRVAARVNDLIRYGYVKESGKKIDARTGKRVSTLVTSDPEISRVINIIKEQEADTDDETPSAVGWMYD